MNRKTTLLALAAMASLAGLGTAGAATSTTHPAATQATCDALMKQADTAITAHKSDTKAKSAQEHRAAGARDCKAGSYAKGAEHLRRAITDLGMKPVD